MGFGTHDHNVLIRGGAVGCIYLSFGVPLNTLDSLSPRPNKQRQIAVVQFFVNISCSCMHGKDVSKRSFFIDSIGAFAHRVSTLFKATNLGGLPRSGSASSIE